MLKSLKKLFADPVITEDDLEMYKRARGLYIEDPWERVKIIFLKDDLGNFHPELVRAFQAAQYGAIMGSGIGGVKEAAKQSKEFIRTNDTNVYLSKNEMYRVMTNKSLLAMGKGGLKWGPKVGLFTGGFTLVASCCEAYRNKSGIIEYVVGGYIAGGISRSAFGIKGFIAGGIIGAVLGLVFGTFKVGIEKISKKDSLVLRYSHYAFTKQKQELFLKMRNSDSVDTTDKLVIGIYGEHTADPLNSLDAEDKSTDAKEELKNTKK